jgi:uncharacterized protein (DUF3084 family)
MNFIKKYWKFIFLGIAVLLVLFWLNSATGVSKKLWKFAKEQMASREIEIVNMLEKENEKIEAERASVQKELNQVKKDRAAKAIIIRDLEEKNVKLKEDLDRITVPTTPGELVDRLKSRGFHPGAPRVR